MLIGSQLGITRSEWMVGICRFSSQYRLLQYGTDTKVKDKWDRLWQGILVLCWVSWPIQLPKAKRYRIVTTHPDSRGELWQWKYISYWNPCEYALNFQPWESKPLCENLPVSSLLDYARRKLLEIDKSYRRERIQEQVWVFLSFSNRISR